MTTNKNKKPDFFIEEDLAYKHPDGTRGWILRIRPIKEKEEKDE